MMLKSDLSEVDVKVINGILNAVAERGEGWRYPEDWRSITSGGRDKVCTNLHPDGSPACIIGFIAVNQGLPTEQFSSARYDGLQWGASGAIKDAMIEAQSSQDRRESWGTATRKFFKELSDLGVTPETLTRHGIDASRYM